MNAGKDFENQFKASIDKQGYFYYRLKDSAQSFGGSSNLRFSSKNPYDCFMFADGKLFCMELKSTKGTSLSFWREDFENKDKHQTFLIHKHQIQGLEKASKFDGVIAGFIINFRETTNHTYFWHIRDFLRYTNLIEKKSINEADVIKNSGILINQELKKVKYTYDINTFKNECIEYQNLINL